MTSGEGLELQELRALLRRARRGRLPEPPPDSESDPEPEPEPEPEAEDAGGGAPPPAAGAPPPAGPALQELWAELGRGRGGAGPERSLPRLLRQREWGRSFSREERSQLSSHFLPNHAAALEPHPQKVFCAVFADGGRRLLTACQDHALRLFEVSGAGLRLLCATRGRHVGWNHALRLFEVSGAGLRLLRATRGRHPKMTQNPDFSPQNFPDHALRLFEVSGAGLRLLHATRGRHSKIHKFRHKIPKFHPQIPKMTQNPDFSPQKSDHALRLFEVSGAGLRLLRATRGRHVGWSILDVALCPDGRQALYCSWSSYVHVFDLHGEGDAHTALDFRPEDRRFAVFSLAVGPDGRDVMGGANDGCVYVYDREAQRRVERVPAHEDDVNAVALADASGQLLLSGGDDAVGRAWDRRCLPEGPALTLAGHRDGLTFLHARGDGRYVVSNSKDQSAKLWDLRRPSGPAALAAARRAVARQSWDYRWQRAPRNARRAPPLPGDASLMTFRGHVVLHTLLRCRLAPPGGAPALAAGSADGAVLVYDVTTGRALRRLANHGACVRDVSWSPEGAWLASASWDGTVRLWDYRDGGDGDDGEGAGPRGEGAGSSPAP
ncbi:DDB1- and CUL4-associated factor 11 [Vidua chalybeata]|uniref:DDB1- and CUL4-associated factor 11 n=1 Tax=Vidua chalybeata TaxID=81927 RepID=UPI0023A90265|nr:DDB1- and CUL4-associated factor 11 [Vidua chalybeata]